MFSAASKAAIAGAIRRSIPRGVAWSVFAPSKIDGDYGTTTGLSLVSALYVKFKRLDLANRPERFVNENRPMYRVTASGFSFAIKQVIKDPTNPSAGAFEVIDVVAPPDSVVPTAHYATVVRIS